MRYILNHNSLKQNQQIALLYQRHSSWLQGWLKQKLDCESQAMDLMQSTFLRLLIKPEKVNEILEPRAYITTIAHGLVNDFWRHQTIERAYLDALLLYKENTQPSEEHKLLIVESLVELSTLLSNLSHPIKEAFLLSQLEGFTYRQIAKKLGLSERTIKNYMAQAMLQCLQIKKKMAH